MTAIVQDAVMTRAIITIHAGGKPRVTQYASVAFVETKRGWMWIASNGNNGSWFASHEAAMRAWEKEDVL